MVLPFLRLRFPVKVDVKNPRLICLFYIVQVLTLIFLPIMFFILDMWAAKTSVGMFIYPTLAVSGLHHQEQLQQVWADKSQTPFCTSPSRFDYRWDAEGFLTYSNHTCLPLCKANESGLHHNCVHLAETYIAQKLDEVFIATQIQDTILPANEHRTQNHFIPTAEGLGVSIRFTYDVPIPPRLHLPAWTQSDFHQTSILGSSTRDVVTVVLDADGNLWRTFLPGEDIQFSIPTLLKLAGDHELLNTPQPHLGPNMLPGAAIPEGPVARLTGFGLEFGLECFDRQYVIVRGHNGFQCLLRVNRFLPGWFSVEHSDLLDKDGHYRHRLTHGIRVSVRTGGHFRFFSFAGMLRFSTYMIVLMALPSRFILFIAVSCLGHLSVVYKKVLFHDFDIYEKVGGFATRLMSSSASFVLLDNTQGNGISKDRMHERLCSAASARASTVSEDTEAVQRFVDYCWHSAVKERNLRASSLADMMTSVSGEISEALRPRRKSHVDDIHLDLEHFSKACTNNEDIPFEVLVGMFSRHRKRKFLERVFTPSNVSRYLFGEEEEELPGDCEDESEASSPSMASNGTPCPPFPPSPAGSIRPPTSPAGAIQPMPPVWNSQESSDAPVLVSRPKGRCRTLEQTKVEADTDHVRIQALENCFSSLEGRLIKLLEELDLRLSNLERRVQDGLGDMDSRARSLDKKTDQVSLLVEKKHADILGKMEGRLQEQKQVVAEMTEALVANAFAAQPLLARLPDFEAQLSELVLLYRQIQPLGGGEAVHPELNYPGEVEVPEIAATAFDPYGYQQSAYYDPWSVDPEIVPNGELAELQPVSYAAVHHMFNSSPYCSPRAAQASGGSVRCSPRAAQSTGGLLCSPRATQASGYSPHCSPRASQASGSEWQHSVRALAQHADSSPLGRALSPTTLRRLGH